MTASQSMGERSASPVLAHRKLILLATVALCLAGAFSARTMPSSVFPQTDFPRVVVLVDHGVMPADEMMATITRPIEEAMKDIPGTREIRSATGRGSAEVNVFFDWSTDMVQAELYVLGRLSQIQTRLPPDTSFDVQRLTFSAFPVAGISLTGPSTRITDLWEQARYELTPRLLRVPGVARVKIVGGRRPEFHVVVDLAELEARHLGLEDVSRALGEANVLIPAGMHEEDHQLYLNVLDNRVRGADEVGDVVVAYSGTTPVRIRDVAEVRRGAAPQFNVVTADGARAVLLNVYGQPDSDTLGLVAGLRQELEAMRAKLGGDRNLSFFYDQSRFVAEGVRSVWESIFLGIALSALVLFAFLRSPSATLIAAAVIPVTILLTLVGLKVAGMSFNLMTLGGIAAAVGLVIDDAIVVVEAVHTKLCAGNPPTQAVVRALAEVGRPLVGSTLTPVVVFLPLAFLDGVSGVFFRALAFTMVFAILGSLLLSVTWTPTLAASWMRSKSAPHSELEQGGRLLRSIIELYTRVLRAALRHPLLSLLGLALVLAGSASLYRSLDQEFLPEMDEGAFVLDYYSRPGTSLTETDRMLREVERILLATPEVESYSRRTGARLALAIAEPNTGDFLVKLRADRRRSTTAVVDELRERIRAAVPALVTEFPGVLSDLIGDLTWSPDPVEVKLFSPDASELESQSARIAGILEGVPGVVDVSNGLVVAGPTLSFRVRTAEAARAGTNPAEIGGSLRTALLGTVPSHVLIGDRTVDLRVVAQPEIDRPLDELLSAPLRGTGPDARAGDPAPVLADLVDVQRRGGQLEVHREDLRQVAAVSARFSGVDMNRGIRRIRAAIEAAGPLPAGMSLEFGGTYRVQQESFRNLALVLAAALVLVFGVLVAEFRAVLPPLAIILGAALAMVGVEAALHWTHTSLNIVSYLGAIIGVGIVAKNGILMLDYVRHVQSDRHAMAEALVLSGRRRLRPVLMTSMTTFLGLLPLAWGVGAGADMLRPLAIAIMGALTIALPLSLLATPVGLYLMLRLAGLERAGAEGA